MENNMDIDIKPALEFYKIEKSDYTESLCATADAIMKSAAASTEFERLHRALFIDPPYNYDAFWGKKPDCGIRHFAAVLILSAYKLHAQNMEKAGFDEAQKAAHIHDMRHICTDEVLLRGFDEVRFTQAVWSARFIHCEILSAGRLQFEREDAKKQNVPNFDGLNKHCILMHIPARGRLDPAAVDASIKEGRELIKKYFTSADDKKPLEIFCKSWLLSEDIVPFLPQGSNILAFQKRFELLRRGGNKEDFEYFVLGGKSNLAEKLREYVKNGGELQIGVGRLK